MTDERQETREDERRERREDERLEPFVQMTTPHVALNCLINCPPSGKKFDNSAPQLSFSKHNQLIN